MTNSALELTVVATQSSLEGRLRAATSRTTLRGQPRDTYARTDTFLAATSRHLGAVDEVLLPLVRRRVPDGHDRVREYLHQARHLELALATLKARLYGEAHAVFLSWPRVWEDVRVELSRHNTLERELVARLLPVLADDEHTVLAERVYRSEVRGPTRPHPYTPHTGIAGLIARKMWAVADRFWDTAEGRVIPEPIKPRSHEHDADSLLAQYLMGEPHFDANATVVKHRHPKSPTAPES